MKKAIFVFLILNTIFGVTHNVPADFSEIQLAIDNAVEGDTILVAPGEYYENLYIEINLVIRSTGEPEETIINGGGIDKVIDFHRPVDNTTEFSGFTITNGYVDPSIWQYSYTLIGAGIYCYKATPELSNLIITENVGRYGSALGYYSSFYYGNYANLKNVVISNNNNDFQRATVYMYNSKVNIINCTIVDNSVTSPLGGQIELNAASQAILVNTLVYGDMNGAEQQIVIQELNDPCELTIAHSNIEGGEAGVNTNDNGVLNWLDGNIDADPMLDDEYHLDPDSPCIDAATPYYEFSTFTLNMLPDEYDGPAPDMGAYEWSPVYGCTDPLAMNYNPEATDDDGSCESGSLGDVNNDGTINVSDIVQTVDIILNEPGTPYQMWAADYNEDGLVNVSDIVQIVSVILDLPLAKKTIATASYQLVDNQLVIATNGAIAGLQMKTDGDYQITTNYLPAGWEFHNNGETILAFNLGGDLLHSGTVLAYTGTMNISNMIISDQAGNNILNMAITPNQFVMHPTYPNPFNPVTNLNYDLPEDCYLTIKVYNMQGQMVEELVSNQTPAGNYKITWNADNQPSGMYFVQMTTETAIQTQKIILLK
jgi:hypothetical protein